MPGEQSRGSEVHHFFAGCFAICSNVAVQRPYWGKSCFFIHPFTIETGWDSIKSSSEVMA